MGGHRIVQRLVYENVPAFCSSCLTKGHVVGDCIARAKHNEVTKEGGSGSGDGLTFFTTGDGAKGVNVIQASTSVMRKESGVKGKVKEPRVRESTKQWVSRTFYNFKNPRRRVKWAPKRSLIELVQKDPTLIGLNSVQNEGQKQVCEVNHEGSPIQSEDGSIEDRVKQIQDVVILAEREKEGSDSLVELGEKEKREGCIEARMGEMEVELIIAEDAVDPLEEDINNNVVDQPKENDNISNSEEVEERDSSQVLQNNKWLALIETDEKEEGEVEEDDLSEVRFIQESLHGGQENVAFAGSSDKDEIRDAVTKKKKKVKKKRDKSTKTSRELKRLQCSMNFNSKQQNYIEEAKFEATSVVESSKLLGIDFFGEEEMSISKIMESEIRERELFERMMSV